MGRAQRDGAEGGVVEEEIRPTGAVRIVAPANEHRDGQVAAVMLDADVGLNFAALPAAGGAVVVEEAGQPGPWESGRVLDSGDRDFGLERTSRVRIEKIQRVAAVPAKPGQFGFELPALHDPDELEVRPFVPVDAGRCEIFVGNTIDSDVIEGRGDRAAFRRAVYGPDPRADAPEGCLRRRRDGGEGNRIEVDRAAIKITDNHAFGRNRMQFDPIAVVHALP